MEKPINNPFAANPAMKFGVSPDPSVIRPEARMQENRAGVQRVPQRSYPYQGAQRPQAASNPQYSGNRSYRVPTPVGTAPAGVNPPGTTPAGIPSTGASPAAQGQANRLVSAAANMTSQDAGYGMTAGNQKISSAIDAKKSDENSNKAGEKRQANAQPEGMKKIGSNMADSLKLDFTEDNLLRGFVMSEILGKPKCFNRGRW